MASPIISVENLGKKYRLSHERERGIAYRRLSEDLWNFAKATFRFRSPNELRSTSASHAARTGSSSIEDFWAIKDMSFTVNKGEVVGIIGRNGAGKSTLLKILSRITEPTSGRVRIKGRVASLLEVGTGFHPELTGRENIFLNGAILGMTRAEINRKFDEIVAFADVEKFLDTPVKRYSSGMYVRLAFAVAAHLEPEILVVDEVLAVGDAQFQKKCLGKMEAVATKEGRTILFVSHQLNTIRNLCTHAVLLEAGRLVCHGSSDEVIRQYLARPESTSSEWTRCNGCHIVVDEAFTPTTFAIVDENLNTLRGPATNDTRIGILLEGEFALDPRLYVGFAVYNESEDVVFWATHTDEAEDRWPKLHKGNNRLVCWLPKRWLNEGTYQVRLLAAVHHVRWIYQPWQNSISVAFTVTGGLSESPMWQERRPGIMAPNLSFERLN